MVRSAVVVGAAFAAQGEPEQLAYKIDRTRSAWGWKKFRGFAHLPDRRARRARQADHNDGAK
jgi:hypothetical protein